jgi:hypothetical protein
VPGSEARRAGEHSLWVALCADVPQRRDSQLQRSQSERVRRAGDDEQVAAESESFEVLLLGPGFRVDYHVLEPSRVRLASHGLSREMWRRVQKERIRSVRRCLRAVRRNMRASTRWP